MPQIYIYADLWPIANGWLTGKELERTRFKLFFKGESIFPYVVLSSFFLNKNFFKFKKEERPADVCG